MTKITENLYSLYCIQRDCCLYNRKQFTSFTTIVVEISVIKLCATIWKQIHLELSHVIRLRTCLRQKLYPDQLQCHLSDKISKTDYHRTA